MIRSAWCVGLLLGFAAMAGSAEVLRVGTTGDYPPFSHLDVHSGQFQGADIDQAQALGAALQRQVVFVPTSWRRLSADLAAGRFDIAMGGISITPERAAQGVFTPAYLQDGKTPLVRCADRARFATLAQINRPQVRVVVNTGGTNERFARAWLNKADLHIFDDNIAIFDQILTNSADVMVTDAVEAKLQQRLRPGLCAVHPERPFDHSAKAYWLPADSPLLPQVQAWVAGALRRGEVQASLARWLAYDWRPSLAQAQSVSRLLALVDERLSLMPAVARYKWNQGAAIEDLPREQALLRSVREQALRQGLDPDGAALFFAAQIEASKVVQRELFAVWQAEGRGAFADVVDLQTRIRPRLDELNPVLLAAWAAVRRPLAPAATTPWVSQAPSAAAASAAVAPLLQ